MVKPAQRRVEHVAAEEFNTAAAWHLPQALACEFDQLGRQVDGHHVSATPGCLDRQGAGAAARV